MARLCWAGPCLMNMHVLRISLEFEAIWCKTNVFWLIRNIIRNMQFCVIHYLTSVRNLSASVIKRGAGAQREILKFQEYWLILAFAIEVFGICISIVLFWFLLAWLIIPFGTFGFGFASRLSRSHSIIRSCFCSLFLCKITKHSISIAKWERERRKRKYIELGSTVSAANQYNRITCNNNKWNNNHDK